MPSDTILDIYIALSISTNGFTGLHIQNPPVFTVKPVQIQEANHNRIEYSF
jgi:hypothetical protein